MPLRDYLNIMSDRTEKTRQQIEDLRAANPDQAAKEDERMKLEQIKKQEEYVALRMQIGIAEKNRAVIGEYEARGDPIKQDKRVKVASPLSANKDISVLTSNAVTPPQPPFKRPKKDQISDININKYKEADYVGRETIDLINKEAEVSDINASHMNKTDRFGGSKNVLSEE
jgi:hypothetical protein